ncbi:MAG: hypothetical protein BMS9Abin02_1814 [Anaerolineae bacterium]|nr:MAG: hypothetical protein BMS9Abin02_1814 [Anaerolineae bacterium]
MKKRDQHRIVGTLFFAQSLFSTTLISALTLSAIVVADLRGNEPAAGMLALSLFGLGLSFLLLFWVVWVLIPGKQALILPAGQD